jgi:thiamine kinase-like enzyme
MNKKVGLLKAIDSVHSLDIECRSFNIYDQINNYLKVLRNILIRNTDKFKYSTYYDTINRDYALVSKLAYSIAYNTNINRYPCHNDLVPENVMIKQINATNASYVLIDWEYAGYNDIAWDYASLLLECDDSKNLSYSHYLDNEFVDYLTDKYSESDPNLMIRILINMLLQDYLSDEW